MSRIRLAAAGLVALALLAPAHAASIAAGDAAPPVRLPDRSGQVVSLAALRGQPVVVDFWASWCAVCRTALPALDALARRRAGDGVRVLAVNVDRSRAAADAWLAARLPSPAVTVLLDPEGATLARFGADGMPALYVVDRDGVVRLALSGAALERLDAVERVLDALAPAP